MKKIQINQKKYNLDYIFNNIKNTTLIECIEAIGIYIPNFCYNQELSISGNCRMCVIEAKTSIKPIISCVVNAKSYLNNEIYTRSPLTFKSRESIIEFLLLNHPIDCAICDQAGECDLQDYALIFGTSFKRFYTYKRTVDDKHVGFIIKTTMTRCIHCTRCVRFGTEVAGLKEFGIFGRGSSSEVGLYLSSDKLTSELSGNFIDVCPVGSISRRIFKIARASSIRGYIRVRKVRKLTRDRIHQLLKIIRDSILLLSDDEKRVSADPTSIYYEDRSSQRARRPEKTFWDFNVGLFKFIVKFCIFWFFWHDPHYIFVILLLIEGMCLVDNIRDPYVRKIMFIISWICGGTAYYLYEAVFTTFPNAFPSKIPMYINKYVFHYYSEYNFIHTVLLPNILHNYPWFDVIFLYSFPCICGCILFYSRIVVEGFIKTVRRFIRNYRAEIERERREELAQRKISNLDNISKDKARDDLPKVTDELPADQANDSKSNKEDQKIIKGALTNRPSSFTIRPWEHLYKMSLDSTNSFSQYIKVAIAYNKVQRVLPSFINEYEEETPWINDKTRFAFEGVYSTSNKTMNKKKFLFIQDIIHLIYFYDQLSSQFYIKVPNIFFIFGNTISIELLSLLDITLKKYSFLKMRTFETLPIVNNDIETNYQLNESVKSLQFLTKSDLCLLVGANTRYEGSYLNLKLRKRYLKDDFKIVSFSSYVDTTLPIHFLGSLSKTFNMYCSGNNVENQDFMLSNNPIIIINSEFFQRKDSNNLFNLIETLKSYTFFTYKDWNGLNILNNSLNSVGICTINKFSCINIIDLITFNTFFFINTPSYSLHINKFINMKILNYFYRKPDKRTRTLRQMSFFEIFDIVMPHHKYRRRREDIYRDLAKVEKVKSLFSYGPIHQFDFINTFKKTFKITTYKHFTSKNIFETSGTFQNAEGFIKKSLNIISSKRTIQEDWQYLRLISKNINNYYFFTNGQKNNIFVKYNLKDIFKFKNYIALNFYAIKNLNDLAFFYLSENSTFFLIIDKFFLTIQKNFNTKFKFWLEDFYLGGYDIYSTYSKTMILCSNLLREKTAIFINF